LKFLFLGTGGYARDVLDHLLDDGLRPLAVITGSDRPSGRGLRARPSPVALLAERKGLEIHKLEKPAGTVFEEILERHRPDVALVCDYGSLIPGDVLSLLPGRFLNLHPSLLPRYRGAAPIRRALMEGSQRTGVSLMVIDEGLDSGPVVDALETDILAEDDAGTLGLRLAEAGARLVETALPAYLEGRLRPREQDPRLATYAPPLRKEELLIDWGMPASDIHNRIRALAPRPGARGRLGGKWLKILRSRPRQDILDLRPGELARDAKRGMLVGTGRGALEILLLQPEGRRIMDATEFLRGYRGGSKDFFEAVSESG